jgi:DNA polymerase III subunit delta'
VSPVIDVDGEADNGTSATPVLPLEYLPWHDDARGRVAAALEGGRLTHALLLHGPEGLGKQQCANTLAAGLHCAAPGPVLLPCGRCPECLLSRAGTHPDLHWLRRPEDRKSIGVDAVREVCQSLGMTSLRGGRRIAVVVQAELMTTGAQNAFLKTLEEPAAGTLLMLVTARPSAVLPTLRSRCQRVAIARPSRPGAAVWLAGQLGERPPDGLLELAGGAPLRALELAPHYAGLEAQMNELLGDLLAGRIEATRAAAAMQGEGLGTRLDWIERWLQGALHRRLVDDATRVEVPAAAQLQRAAAAVNMHAALRIVERLRESRRLLQGSAAAPLVTEALLVELAAVFRRRGVA